MIFSARVIPLPWVRFFKCALPALAWLVILASCATQRRCLQKWPPVPVDTVVTVVTQWRDTVIYVTVPADTVVDSVAVIAPCDTLLKGVRVKTATDIATAEAWVQGGKLRVKLVINERQLAIKIDSAATLKKETVTIVKTQVVEKKVIPTFYKAMLFVTGFLFLLVLAIIFLALRR